MNGWIILMDQVAENIETDLYTGSRRKRRRSAPGALIRLRTTVARALVRVATWVQPNSVAPDTLGELH